MGPALSDYNKLNHLILLTVIKFCRGHWIRCRHEKTARKILVKLTSDHISKLAISKKILHT
jgi:hypothetical protein